MIGQIHCIFSRVILHVFSYSLNIRADRWGHRPWRRGVPTTVANYRTTKGILKPILAHNGQFRSARAKVFGVYSNTVKGTGLGLSIATNIFTAAQVYDQYEEGGGNVNNINSVDAIGLTVGTIGVVANGLSWAGRGGAAMSTIGRFAGYGGMAIGIAQSWWNVYEGFDDLTRIQPTTGTFEGDMQMQLNYDNGLRNEWDYYK